MNEDGDVTLETSRTETTHTRTYSVTGAPDLTKQYSRALVFRPEQATVTFVDKGDGPKLTKISVTGPRVLKGDRLGDQVTDGHWMHWAGVPDDRTPTWLAELAKP